MFEFYSANVVTPNLSCQSKPPKSQKQKTFEEKEKGGFWGGFRKSDIHSSSMGCLCNPFSSKSGGNTSAYYLAAFLKKQGFWGRLGFISFGA